MEKIVQDKQQLIHKKLHNDSKQQNVTSWGIIVDNCRQIHRFGLASNLSWEPKCQNLTHYIYTEGISIFSKATYSNSYKLYIH